MNSTPVKYVALLSAGLIGLALAGCASDGQKPERAPPLAAAQCVMRPLDDTRVIDRQTLLIRDVSGRGALVHMTSPCLEVNETVIMKYFGTGTICGPLDVDIASAGQGMVPQHCMIDHLTPLNKDEANRMLLGPVKPKS